MQLMATGKWSKADKRWNMVVAMRRPAGTAPVASAARPEGRKALRQKPRKGSES